MVLDEPGTELKKLALDPDPRQGVYGGDTLGLTLVRGPSIRQYRGNAQYRYPRGFCIMMWHVCQCGNKGGKYGGNTRTSNSSGCPGDCDASGVSTDTSRPWIVNWTGIWVGALAALATALILGLIAIAVGAHEVGPGARIDKWSDVRLGTLVFSVMGAFMSFV